MGRYSRGCYFIFLRIGESAIYYLWPDSLGSGERTHGRIARLSSLPSWPPSPRRARTKRLAKAVLNANPIGKTPLGTVGLFSCLRSLILRQTASLACYLKLDTYAALYLIPQSMLEARKSLCAYALVYHAHLPPQRTCHPSSTPGLKRIKMSHTRTRFMAGSK
jgi:hypothetical protein